MPGLRHNVVVFLFFGLLAAAGTWPVAAILTSRVLHDPGDPILNTWILWWSSQAVPLTDTWWNAPIFVPLPGALALSEHLLGIAVLTAPLQLAGASPLAAYNVAFLLSYALSGAFTYLLVFRSTRSVLASASAGIAFAFAPYRAGQLAHLQVLTAQWMPLVLLGMQAYVETGRRRWLAVFGLAWLLQALSNGYYLLFLPVLIVLWIAWFTDWRARPARGIALLAAWALASLPLVPVLMGYQRIHGTLGLARSLADIRQFSARLDSFSYAPPLLAFWPAGENASSAEDWLFPGLTVSLLAMAGLVAALFRPRPGGAVARRSPALFYAAAAVVMLVLALGPGGEPGGPPSPLRPYTWLIWLPGYSGLRVPARFAMLGALCLAVAGGLAISALLRRGGRGTRALAVVALAGIAADGAMERVPMSVPPQRAVLDNIGDAAVIEIPTDDAELNAAAMYRAMFHRRALVNGYSGYTPYHYSILSLSLWRGDTSVLTYLAQERPLAIIVSSSADSDGGFRKMIAGMPGIESRGLSGAGAAYLLPPQPLHETGAPGAPLAAQVSASDDRRVVADLGERRTVTGVAFALRGRYKELDGRVLIEVSDDNQNWRQAWLGWTGAFAFDAALRDPAVAPVVIPIPPTTARWVRFYPAARWMVPELTVIGH
jgi:hypothetical protein